MKKRYKIIIWSLLLMSVLLVNNKADRAIVSFALNVPNITVEEAKQKLEDRFANYNITSIEYIEEEIPNEYSYLFSISLGGNEPILMKITKNGGFIIVLDGFPQNISKLVEEYDCVQALEKFIESLGFNNLKAVWSTTIQDEKTVNLAPVEEGVVIYPDLLKARINCKTGDVLSVEARSYMYGYTEDKKEQFIPEYKPKLSFEEASKSIDSKFNIVDHRLAVILHPDDVVCLTYEIKTENEDNYYYFYIDANTGELKNVIIAVK